MPQKREKGRFARDPLMRPEWVRYWEDPSAPHPDSIGSQNRSQPGRRAHPSGQGYCHHYRRGDEHYHSSMEELERCPK